MKPALLLGNANAERMLDGALSDRFDFIRLWEAKDARALLNSRGKDVVAVFAWDFDAALLDLVPNLRLITVPGAGYEKLDVTKIRARGIKIANAGDTHSGDVADHAVALLISSIHLIPKAHASVLEGAWAQNKHLKPRHAMSAQRFGIVGLGNIGVCIAKRLAPFGGEIAWWGPRAKPSTWRRFETLKELAEWCSVLILAVRGDAIGLIDAEIIKAVGPEGLIVNISRGGVIDEDAMIAALKDGRLGSAALDVFVQEPTPRERWIGVPNTVLTPHIAGVAYESIAHLRDAAIRNLSSVLDGTPLVNEIN